MTSDGAGSAPRVHRLRTGTGQPWPERLRPPAAPRPRAAAADTPSEPPVESPTGEQTSAAGTKPQTRRFVEPYPLDAEQRRLLEQALVDAGIDDAGGRAIFIGAIAYELARLAAALEGPPPQPAPEPEPPPAAEPRTALAALAEAAARARRQLLDLAAEDAAVLADALAASDRFARGHEDGYRTAVAAELERIAAAAAGLAVEPEGPGPDDPAAASAPADGLPDAASGFVAATARVYREAFELTPGTGEPDPFPRVLSALAEVTGLPIPTATAALEQQLTDPGSAR